MKSRASLLVILTLVLMIAPVQADQNDWMQFDLLGIGLVWIDVPRGLEVRLTRGFERVVYDVRRVRGTRVMRIIEQPEISLPIVRGPSAHYCVNGISGVTQMGQGLRKILLRLPEEAYNYQFYFEYRYDDQTAAQMMKTVRVPRYHKRCSGRWTSRTRRP